MSRQPERLSIIVPVYNEARTVRAVIDRLLTIDLPVPREILVVDDGSTDGTGDVLDRTAAERISRNMQGILTWGLHPPGVGQIPSRC